ncbi:UDP-3-O-acylglucosamine N-acyltransferase [Gemmata obscuriglobus]|uniref:UDP-3-O-(3-hydroxymyristoyl)glucosamine N-acyltransferase n=1 Tax=Gemmata obscuriglobus TaxID=114 RepID=UPI00016C3A14|nr:UDP-3-O-(3-hydroxymyristoyl)glucosamine N-acyltransferase [Gemmata obscuriglobus]QEG29057.1 UDP-3-O-acylglucosamine N-acyltransferase [Gemmata obscuriglobus]VTS07689.1 udp-3-o-(3-hydroxymyristoyl) glucosamine n-acyltransferase : UDP-3-O-acylglucosamine N-acyltransferase OS=Singulisphaera acidiphila (strain ATCC BAA-1392 / DSM 18658 / VKM B-2454 / MOB10) GN=lpxD PE=3 SV=1: LpxD: Hexapep: Hexapep: Hexapep: Hexapep [Gemmata obscuriglobus UQM 2246]
MNVTVRQLAEWVRGEVLGDPELAITNARTLSEAEPGDITFVESERNLHAWHNSRASAAVVPASVPVNGRPVIRVADPLMAFADIVRHLRARPDETPRDISPGAHVHPTAKLAPGVSVGPLAVIGEGTELGENCTVHAGAIIGRFCKIGRDAIIYPHVVLYDDCVLGDRVILHAGAVIGADGFGYRTANGKHHKVPQLGWVELEDDVEIGANSTVDRGTFAPTRIGAGTKIDNLVMVGHNCQIGKHNLYCSQSGVAGSCVTGDYVVLAGQAGIADHVTIGDRAMVGAQAGVPADLPGDLHYLGTPAMPVKEMARVFASLRRLPELREELRQLKKRLDAAEGAG